MAARDAATGIHFEATVLQVEGSTLVRLPDKASRGLPSRGQVAVRGTLNDRSFETVVEPDGAQGHWIKLEPKLQKAVGLSPGDTVVVQVEPAPEWPEPDVPGDLAAALAAAPKPIRALWQDITPMARWEWVRWVNATRN